MPQAADGYPHMEPLYFVLYVVDVEAFINNVHALLQERLLKAPNHSIQISWIAQNKLNTLQVTIFIKAI